MHEVVPESNAHSPRTVPGATGMIEGACRFVIEIRFGITGARWPPDGAEDILKLRAVVVNGDLDGNYSEVLWSDSCLPR